VATSRPSFTAAFSGSGWGLGARSGWDVGSRRGLGSERWWFLPEVSVGASWSRTEFGGTRDGLTFSPRNEGTAYWLNLAWRPLQRPGGVAADYRRASAGLQIAQAELELRRASLVRQVEASLDRLAGARVLQDRSALNVRLAQRQREQEEERYRLGVGTLSDRLEAEALAAQAARQEITARYATLRALAELEQASGVSFLDLR
jgi:outer membrane protein TolC